MADITAQGRIPLLVGGTMLYFRGLQQGLARLPDADPAVRLALLEEAGRLGWPALHQRLAQLDPVTAAQVHPNDPQRIQRALEVRAISGEPMSTLIRRAQGQGDRRCPIGCSSWCARPTDRQTLHARIERRFRGMVEQGLVGEVEALWQRGDLHEDLPAMRCVGYRQVLQFLLHGGSFDEMLHRGIVATRQLAKRQFTWLRSETACHWLADDPPPHARALELIAPYRD